MMSLVFKHKLIREVSLIYLIRFLSQSQILLSSLPCLLTFERHFFERSLTWLCVKSCICIHIDSVPFWRMSCSLLSCMNCLCLSLFSTHGLHEQTGTCFHRDSYLSMWSSCKGLTWPCNQQIFWVYVYHDWNWRIHKRESRHFLTLR